MTITGSRAVLLLLLLFPLLMTAQETTVFKEKISTVIGNYFELDRETIHLHFDKTTFFTNEEVFFKGYVYNRKAKEPYYETTNVHALLLDESGKLLAEKLFFSSNGTFLGNIALDPSYASGTYYIQVFTNWMNNFSEDESSVFPITIINTQTGPAPDKDHFADADVKLFPEGGTLLSGVNNTIGVRVTGCGEVPFANGEIEVFNKGESLKKITLNRFGLGKFDIVPETGMTVRFSTATITKEVPIPAIESSGVALEINNFTLSGKTIIKARTTAALASQFVSNPLFIVIQQDDKAKLVDIPFSNSKTEQQLVLSNELLYEGVNTIRLVDSNMKQWAERLVFIYPTPTPSGSVAKEKEEAGLSVFKGNGYDNAVVSVSVLPQGSLSYDEKRDAFSTFYFQPYVLIPVTNARYYLDQPSKARHYELDLALLAQPASRQSWFDILNFRPAKKFEFEKGQTISGTLSQPVKNREKYKVKLYSNTLLLQEFSEIDEKGQFEFPNMVITDSSSVRLYLVEVPGFEPKAFKFSANVRGRKGNFSKIFRPTVNSCPVMATESPISLPKFAGITVQLNETEVKSKNVLKRQNWPGHHDLNGYKVPEYATQRVSQFLESKGFNVVDNNVSVMITARGGATTINGAPRTPVLYIDNIKQMTFDQIVGMTMDEIDEIYTNTQTIIPSVTNNQGVIRIYRKKPKLNGTASLAEEFMVDGGFSKIHRFHNPDFASYDTGFRNFAVIGWIPNMYSDASGSLTFMTPDHNQPINVYVEGFTTDGRIISQLFQIQ